MLKVIPYLDTWGTFQNHLFKNIFSSKLTHVSWICPSPYIWFMVSISNYYTPAPRRGRGLYCFTSFRLSVLPSVQDIFRRIFLSNCWWQKSDIWSQASYRYAILWEVFLDPSDSYFLFADFVDFYTHWTYILYMPIFSRIFLSNYWWKKSDIWSQASYRYPISWESFFDPSDSYFLFAEERGYHKWALAHSSSCYHFCGNGHFWIFVLFGREK
jgi:hypothetical protein